MLLITNLLLLSAISIGVYMVFLGLRHHRRAPALGLLHALLAISGITLLFILIFNSPVDKLNNIAALFLLLAVLGGVMVFALREDNRPPSMTMVTAHAIMGLIGVTLLLVNFL